MENKYTPLYTQVESQPSCRVWKVPPQEHQFYYVNDKKFKHNIDLDLARESSEKRLAALKKLFFEYKNKETFHVARKMQRKTAQMPQGIVEQDLNENEVRQRKIRSMMQNYNTAESGANSRRFSNNKRSLLGPQYEHM